MALIIEDGSIVPGADSFVTVAEARTYAANYGLTLPADDTDVEVLLRKAKDYLNKLENDGRYQGERESEEQVLCFPREDIYIYSKDVSGEIPQILKDGQSRLAADYNSTDLLRTGTGREVLEQEVEDAVTVKYAESGVSNFQANPTAALAILDPLFIPSQSGINLTNIK